MIKTFTLSSSGIKNIICEEKDFAFIFGNKEIHMNTISAEFISPIVSHLHITDPTINSLHYEYQNKNDFPQFNTLFTDDMISFLHLLSTGSSVSMNPEQIHKIQQISILLSNYELFNELQKINNSSDNLDDNLNNLQLFEYMSTSQVLHGLDFSPIIDVISSNFNTIDKNKMKKLSKPLLFKIISNPNLKVKDEDSLFDFIKEIFDDDEDDQSLTIIVFLEVIDMKNLSDEKFKEAIQRINPNLMTVQLWQNLCHRFLDNGGEDENTKKKSDDKKYETFEYQSGNDEAFNGIMYALSKKTGGNVYLNGTIDVTCDSYQILNPIQNLVDFDSESAYSSNDSKLATIRFDFKDKLIHPSSYKVKTANNGKNHGHPKNWVIEVSNDGEHFIEIDRHENDSTLNGPMIIKSFNVQQKNNEFYRYIQLRQTDQSWHKSGNGNLIAFRHIDFYGKIKIPNNQI